MDKVVHFEIPADDMERVQKFYGDTFGWKINPMPEMNYTTVQTTEIDEKTRMIKEPGAINGGIMKRDETHKYPDFVIGVKDINEALEKIKTAGGEAVTEKMPVGDMGWSAYFKDTEGNLVGLWETNPKFMESLNEQR